MPKLQKNESEVIDSTKKKEQTINTGNDKKDDDFWLSELNLKIATEDLPRMVTG